MNAPLTLKPEATQDRLAPSSIRAHLLHQLRSTYSPESLRREVPGGSGLPRAYWQKALGTPLGDFLGRGSKMIRARITEWAWNAAGGQGELPMEIPLAVEALHAGSLVIDDIEDEAETRRGDVSLHQRYGLGTALNAGNWLYFWPARLIGDASLAPERELAALKKLGDTQYRCHLGQGLDVSLRITDIHQSDVMELTASKTTLKTGALMGLSTYLGAIASGADLASCENFARFGERLGEVLQILDDAGTISSDHRNDKAREDLGMGTPTWPWAFAAESLNREEYRKLLDLSHDVQADRTEFTFLRQHLRRSLPGDLDAQLESRLENALDEVRPSVQNLSAITAIRREFERMQAAYV